MLECLGLPPPPPHWVPDAHTLCCSACGTTFGLLLRKHHCRCCGSVYCQSCSSRSTSLPGWGIEQSVRVCEECYIFEAKQLPMLLAGDLFWKPASWTGLRYGRYLRLSADQSTLVRATWRDEDSAERRAEEALPLARLTCVSIAPDGHCLELHNDGAEVLVFEAEAMQAAAWASALARIIAILKQRHSYERLYGGTAGTAIVSPCPVAVLAPQIHRFIELRQARLTEAQQARLRARSSRQRSDSDDGDGRSSGFGGIGGGDGSGRSSGGGSGGDSGGGGGGGGSGSGSGRPSATRINGFHELTTGASGLNGHHSGGGQGTSGHAYINGGVPSNGPYSLGALSSPASSQWPPRPGSNSSSYSSSSGGKLSPEKGAMVKSCELLDTWGAAA